MKLLLLLTLSIFALAFEQSNSTDIQDLKTGCFIKQNPARAAGFLFVVVSFRFTFVVSDT